MLDPSLLHEISQHLSAVFLSLGVPRPSAVILALLYVMDHPLDSGEISSITGYSKSSISQAVKFLESHRLISRVKKGRKSAYRPSLPLGTIVAELHIRSIESAASRLRACGARAPALKERVEKLEEELREAVRAVKYGGSRDNGSEL